MWDTFKRWPILITGILMIGWAVALSTDPGRPEALALLLGVGCVLLGVGVTLIVQDIKNEDKEDE